jgi:hypothetical protein
VRVRSTSDISLEILRGLNTDLDADFRLEVDQRQFFMKSVEPPSWVSFLEQLDWWVQILGAGAAIFVAELIKEAAKDTWKNRGKIVSSTLTLGNKVKQLATALSKLRHQLPRRMDIAIGIPEPDDHFSTSIELEGDDVDELAVQIALFVHHLPALKELMKEEKLDKRTVAGGISLRLEPDASLRVWWQDNGTLDPRERILPFTI